MIMYRLYTFQDITYTYIYIHIHTYTYLYILDYIHICIYFIIDITYTHLFACVSVLASQPGSCQAPGGRRLGGLGDLDCSDREGIEGEPGGVYGDFPIFPIENGNFPIENGDFPMGFDDTHHRNLT